MPTVLHLSDLHFGYDHDAVARKQRAEALDLLVEEVAGLTGDWKPEILVISGDLTWQGKASGYGELAKWLRGKLFKATRLKAADCVICAGNHDIDRKAASVLEKRTGDPRRADELLNPELLEYGFARPFESMRIPAPVLLKKLKSGPQHRACRGRVGEKRQYY